MQSLVGQSIQQGNMPDLSKLASPEVIKAALGKIGEMAKKFSGEGGQNGKMGEVIKKIAEAVG